MYDAWKKVLTNQEDNHMLPFFWQHGEDEATLREYVRTIHDANIGAFCVESRPHPDFCGPKWWQDMDVILDEAKKYGMQVWILDDSHFPTGFANGAFTQAVTDGSEKGLTAEENPDIALLRESLVVQYVEVPAEGITIDLADYKEAAPWQPSQIEGMMLRGKTFPTFHDDKLVAVVALEKSGASVDLTDTANADGKIIWKPENEGAKIAILHTTKSRGPHRDYMNMMLKESCRKLIDAVYEPHWAHYADDFGKTIAGFFSDEPEIGNGHLYAFGERIGELDDQCWSAEVAEALQEKWGADFRRFLPFIWNQEGDPDLQARIRCAYMDAVTRAVERDFSFQVGDWCRAHGVRYIGHLIEDDHQHTRTLSSLGHYFRGLAGQDMAGVDDIGGQIMPQGEAIGPGNFLHPERDGEFWHYTLGKLGASGAAIDPLKHGDAMCEAFGAYGWGEGVQMMKYIADHLMVRGINNFVPHAFSPMAFPDPDCPPHFYAHGHNPQYRHFGALMKYMNRVTTLTSEGKSITPVAILYNAEADWSGGNFMMLQKVAIPLYDHQIDYHFIPADVFADREHFHTEITRACSRTPEGEELICGGLGVNGNNYCALLIPQMDYIPQAVAKAIPELVDTCAKVAFIGGKPVATVEGGHGDPCLVALAEIPVIEPEEIPAFLEGHGFTNASIAPANNRIRIYHYHRTTGEKFYFLANEGTETYEGEVTIPGVHSWCWYDAWFNVTGPVHVAEGEDVTVAKVRIEPTKTIFLMLDPEDAAAIAPSKAVAAKNGVDWSEGWTRSTCVPVEYKGFAETVFENAKEVSLPDALEEEAPVFSGFVRYEKTLHIDAVTDTMLEITDAAEGVEVFVNGESLGIQIVPGYYYNLTPYLVAGENRITIEVATTLEREMSQIPNPLAAYVGGAPEPTSKSGICGQVKIYR